MEIAENRVVTLFYRLSNETGQELEASDDQVPIAYLHGAGNLLPALETALEGKGAGDELSVTLPPEQAYGPSKPDSVRRVPIKHLLGRYKRLLPGMLVKVQTEKGQASVRLVKVGKFNVDVDFNHPFAGMTLTFTIKVRDVRAATPEELDHGHAHGDGGHHH